MIWTVQNAEPCADSVTSPHQRYRDTHSTRQESTTMTSIVVDAFQIGALLFGPLILALAQHRVLEPRAAAWHVTLNKSPNRPPAITFPILWTWSYVTLGYTSTLMYARAGWMLKTLYIVHLGLHHVWGVLFLHFRRIHAAAILLMGQLFIGGVLVGMTTYVDAFAGVLCGPYVMWLAVLAYLNVYMAQHNEASARLYGRGKAGVQAERERESGGDRYVSQMRYGRFDKSI